MATKVIDNKKVKKEKQLEKKAFAFRYKSAAIIILTMTLTSILLPLSLTALHLETRIFVLITNSICIPLAVCYCQFYIESNRGFRKSTMLIYALLAIAIAFISYVSLYVNI